MTKDRGRTDEMAGLEKKTSYTCTMPPDVVYSRSMRGMAVRVKDPESGEVVEFRMGMDLARKFREKLDNAFEYAKRAGTDAPTPFRSG